MDSLLAHHSERLATPVPVDDIDALSTAEFVLPGESLSRRRVLKTMLFGAAGMALYAGEIERHWIDVVHRDIRIAGLPQAFEGMTIAQLSDIHLDEYTEPFLLRDAIRRINALQPDMVLLTGDYVSAEVLSKKMTMSAAWQCGKLLAEIDCPQKFAILGNHDIMAGANEITEAIASNGIPVLRNGFLPIERGHGRIWLAGIDDPVLGKPNPDLAMPVAIRNHGSEPIILMCHAPDFVDPLLRHPAGRSIALVLSGHTHGGQVRIPLLGPMHLPPGGRKYIEGLFQVGGVQLYVNRGIGAVGLPFRFNCRPEITRLRLRSARPQAPYAQS
jgi:predicted MPP superfamily phosphohydrolase